MKAIVGKLNTVKWYDYLYDYLLIPLFLLYFYPGIFSIWTTFTSKEFYENGIAFIFVTAVFIFTALKNQDNIQLSGNKIVPLVSFLTVLILNTINTYFFRFSIAPPILLLLGIYSLLGFYLEYRFWKRSVFIFLLLVLTLPLLERVQRFLGFPIRLVTANTVSFLLEFFGIGNISKSAVIVTENHATSIDLPCSGVKSIYTGALFMLAVYYLQKVRISIKLIVITLGFFAALLFFNTWRVFSLVYIYDVLSMKSFGNTVHVFLGVMGFLISCIFFWTITSRYASLDTPSAKTQNLVDKYTKYLKPFLVIVLSILFATNLFFAKQQPVAINQTIQNEYSYKLNGINLTELPFTDREVSYFVNSDVEFSKKFSGTITGGQIFSLLIVTSKSARTHHDPEICLQGLGYKINNSEILQANGLRLRRLTLNDGNDQVLYWYVGKENNLLDYSERVWEEITKIGQTWVLVMIGFTDPIDLSREDVRDLLYQVNLTSKNLVSENKR